MPPSQPIQRFRPKPLHAPAQIALGYAALALLGFLLLRLPGMHSKPTPALDDLFTAVSALSTTGLVTVHTGASYSWIGELVILVLIQLGGIGYMAVGSFFILALRHRISTPEYLWPPSPFPIPTTWPNS